jgi:PAS domain S-box-containing protein
LGGKPYLILFFGSGPDGYHVMAGGFARQLGGADTGIVCAALDPSEPNPLAADVMLEQGIDVTALEAQTPEDIEVFSFDMVVTVGDFDPACRPNLFGMPPHYHWDLPLPPLRHGVQRQRTVYREVARILRQNVGLIFSSRMLHGLSIARQNLALVLDNLAHAVMAHTANRRIFHFNQAAEQITGYRRREVIGRDCHEVFTPLRFCGGDCMFCETSDGEEHGCRVTDTRQTQVAFHRNDGSERILDMTVRPLSDASGAHVGALVSFLDNTELHVLKRRARRHRALRGIVGSEPSMLALFEQIKEVAVVNVPVLIHGESGTGKELIANAIHAESSRADKPFVPVNCGALPDGILESELFGHVRGAFTGAVQDKRGRFELADGGTLFLDEVGELSPSMQVKLLRVLQEHSFERVGGERRINVDVRLISATNHELSELMARGLFRRDLYYRLCVVPISPPPLRDRPRDIPVLVEHFLGLIAKESGRTQLSVSREALESLVAYGWPGNVRELRNVIEFAHVKCRGDLILLEHLPDEILPSGEPDAIEAGRRGPKPKLNRQAVTDALARAKGNKSQAAKLLGVGRTTLYRYLSALESR